MSKVEICWVLTPRCNEKCKYCYRFLDVKEAKLEKNEKILRKLIAEGVKELTWTGGEALLYNGFTDLLKIAKENGIKSKLITNGTIVANNNDIREICNYLDSLTLSIDYVDDDINVKLGRGKQHYNNVKTVLEYLKDKELKVTINTVVSQINIEHLEDLGNFLSKYNINAWRIFKFTPLRETAKKNKELFEVTTEEFNSKKKILNSFKDICKIEYRQGDDFENKYLNIINEGDVTKTENGVDVIVGNILKENFSEILQNSEQDSKFIKTIKSLKRNETVDKIRTIVAYNDDKIRNNIINVINSLDFADVVGTAKNGLNTYSKILELQPDMVFAEYNMSDMNGLELIKKSKKSLDNKAPVFNIIGNIPFDELMKSNDIGYNVNALLDNNDNDKIIRILKEFKENIEFQNI